MRGKRTLPRPKSVKIEEAIKILHEYQNRITIRALFYRLVAKGVIPNTLSQYTNLCIALAKARRNDLISYRVFEDITRHSIVGEHPNPDIDDVDGIYEDYVDSYENAQENALNDLESCYTEYSLPFWHNQPFYIEIWVEKEALVSCFEPITSKYGVTLVPTRGYPSLSQLYDCLPRFQAVPEDREIKLIQFGDYDVRGLDIPQKIERNFADDFGLEVQVQRYALTKDLIARYNLPPYPAKQTDTMIRGWLETEGNVTWELDALPPDVLSQLLEQAIKEHIDQKIFTERNETVQKNRELLRQKVNQYIEQEGLNE